MDSKQIMLNRREFLKITALAGAGLTLALYVSGCGEVEEDAVNSPLPTFTPTPEQFLDYQVDLFLTISSSGKVTITVHQSEMGQGPRTSLAMILSEELCINWDQVTIKQADADDFAYGNQVTGGSETLLRNYRNFRQTGAYGKQIMVAVAAGLWGIEPAACSARDGVVYEMDGDRQIGYGDLVAQLIELEDIPTFDPAGYKDPQDYQIIGTRKAQIDAQAMVEGEVIYGMDVRLEGMLFAAVARSPVVEGSLIDFDASGALQVPGVVDVVEISSGVAVVAENTWSAFKGRDALEINWDEGDLADLNSQAIRERYQQIAAPSQQPEDGTIVQAFYEFPFYAHATMEPMNCTADVQPDKCEVWAPSQNPQEAIRIARSITNLSTEDITVHVTHLGGGFGRRLENDYVEEAVELSALINQPVQVVWSRSDDMKNDFYNPYGLLYASVSLDNIKQIQARPFYNNTQLPTGSWRAVTNNPEAFARESLIDELADHLGRDPLDLRLEIEPRFSEVLTAAAEQADWGSSLPEGWGRGIAAHSTWNRAPTAVVMDVSVDERGTIQVKRVVCAVDCGLVINPDMVEAQVQGGIIFALTAALKDAITVENGRIQQSNFHDYRLLTMAETPKIETIMISSDRNPQGIGEMTGPPTFPALANAVFAATGKRVRRLPIRPEDLI